MGNECNNTNIANFNFLHVITTTTESISPTFSSQRLYQRRPSTNGMLPQTIKVGKPYSLNTPPPSAPSSPIPGQPYNNNFLHPYRPARQSYYAKAYAIRRRWRWWHYLVTALLLLGFAELAIVYGGTVFLSKRPEKIRLPVQQFFNIPYKHMNLKEAINLPRGTHIYHVTKEFGPASMGGLGTVLTALAFAQQKHPHMNVSIVMPHYSFLHKYTRNMRYANLRVDVQTDSEKSIAVPFYVHRYFYRTDGHNISEFDELAVMHHAPGGEIYPLNYDPENTIPIYLIGPGEIEPFKHAFHARKVEEIYNHHKSLPQEWRDQYFCKAVAAFIAWKHGGEDESLFVHPDESTLTKVDIVHLHGATNAYVAKLLHDIKSRWQLGRYRPSIVYTMHDYLDELQYTNTANNVMKFLDKEQSFDSLLKYQYGPRVFMSALGIDYSDFVTFVSESMAADIVEGRLDFYLKELVMPSLLLKAKEGTFVGITNGVSFGGVNPFTHPNLIKNHVAFSPPPLDQGIKALEEWRKPSNEISKDWYLLQKLRVKQYLVKKKVLQPGDEDRPLVLFVGRFQYNKGLEFFAPAVEEFQRNDAIFVALGQPNNYPMSKLRALQKKYPKTVHIISDDAKQRNWGVYLRLAADFAFVPSLTESFGLVAAEGLLFGAGVISTGVGGLREFLTDRPRNTPSGFDPARIQTIGATHNAYLFSSRVSSSATQLRRAIGDALKDWQHVSKWKRTKEAYVRRCVVSALGMGWERAGGPIEQYAYVYDSVIRQSRKKVGLPEVEEEDIEWAKKIDNEEDQIEEESLKWELFGSNGEVIGVLEDVEYEEPADEELTEETEILLQEGIDGDGSEVSVEELQDVIDVAIEESKEDDTTNDNEIENNQDNSESGADGVSEVESSVPNIEIEAGEMPGEEEAEIVNV